MFFYLYSLVCEFTQKKLLIYKYLITSTALGPALQEKETFAQYINYNLLYSKNYLPGINVYIKNGLAFHLPENGHS